MESSGFAGASGGGGRGRLGYLLVSLLRKASTSSSGAVGFSVVFDWGRKGLRSWRKGDSLVLFGGPSENLTITLFYYVFE
ncbi:MAG: hypothetical protein C4584_00490 [Armatimonadetes bacterium]|nr:MAG: hypothetical protein C4584_00490 [Armatimonadota bacterium]